MTERLSAAVRSYRELCGSWGRAESVGTLSEKSMHGIIKIYCCPDITRHEKRVGRFTADILTEEGDIIEIQTRNFSKLRAKLEYFLKEHIVTVVYPLPRIKWLLWVDTESGEVTKRRKSPKKGSPIDVCRELYSIRDFLCHENFRLKILLLEVEEYRYLNGWSRDKKSGSSRMERLPIDIFGELELGKGDFPALLPQEVSDKLPTEFTAAEFKKAAKMTEKTAWYTLKTLEALGVISQIGKNGRAFLYRINE